MHADVAITAQKKALRKEMLEILNALPSELRRKSDEEILRRVADMPPFRQAGRLFTFVGTGWEVDTWPLIETALAAGKQVAVPRCLSGGIMEACLIQSRRDLRQAPPLGLWEPEVWAPVLPHLSIDFALIPCIVCDVEGRRLGRGGGYYDRFLAGAGFTKAAVCRQVVLQERLPVAPHDEKVDYVVTESGIYDCVA